jgi:hypothetical protein
MNFFTRLQGIFFAPQSTLKSLSEKPVWVDALVVLLIVIALFSYITGPYSQQDSLETLKNNVRLRERMGEERYNQMIERLENPSKVGSIIRPFLINPAFLLVGFLFSSLILLGMGRFTSTEGNYVQVLSSYLHANFIDKILGNAVRLVLILMRKSVVQTTTSLALFFPRLEATSASFVILSQVDFFQLWLFGVFGYGLSHIFKIEMKKALFISYGFWLIKSLFYIAIGLLSLHYMR